MAVERSANATWEGDLMEGSGQVSTESGVINNAQVTWSARAVAWAGETGSFP